MATLVTLPPELVAYICWFLPQHAFVMLGRTCKRVNKCIYTNGAVPLGGIKIPADSTFYGSFFVPSDRDLVYMPGQQLIDSMRAAPNGKEAYGRAFWWAKGHSIPSGDTLNVGSVGDASDDSPERIWIDAPPSVNSAQSLKAYLQKNPWIRRLLLSSALTDADVGPDAFTTVIIQAAVITGTVIGFPSHLKPEVSASVDICIGTYLYRNWNEKYTTRTTVSIHDKRIASRELQRAREYLMVGFPFWPLLDGISEEFFWSYIALTDERYFLCMACPRGFPTHRLSIYYAFHQIYEYLPEARVVTVTTGNFTNDVQVLLDPPQFDMIEVIIASAYAWGRSLIDAPLLWCTDFIIRYCVHQCVDGICPRFIHLIYVEKKRGERAVPSFQTCSLGHIHFCKGNH